MRQAKHLSSILENYYLISVQTGSADSGFLLQHERRHGHAAQKYRDHVGDGHFTWPQDPTSHVWGWLGWEDITSDIFPANFIIISTWRITKQDYHHKFGFCRGRNNTGLIWLNSDLTSIISSLLSIKKFTSAPVYPDNGRNSTFTYNYKVENNQDVVIYWIFSSLQIQKKYP